MATYTDAALVDRLIRKAIGFGSTPELDAAAITDLIALSRVDGVTTSEGLQRAASAGWAWKAGLVADAYDLRAASGASLTRDQWWAHCMAMSQAYASGTLSVDGLTLGTDLASGDWSVITFTDRFLTGLPAGGDW